MDIWRSIFSKWGGLALVLLAALVNGLVFVWLVPPWQHYDEPNHFEYAWLVANKETWPSTGEYDQPMRRAVAESMIANGFFADLDFLPDLEATTQPIYIGQFSQIGDPPAYYWLTALGLRLAKDLDITSQLYLGRTISLLIFLATAAVIYGLVGELALRQNHPLRWLAPLTVVLLPAFADSMTSVNNDVLAVFGFSLYLWLALRLIQRGLTWRDSLLLLAAAALCWLTKRTVWLAVGMLPLVLLFSLLRKQPRILFAVLGGGFVVVGLAAFGWGDPAFWQRDTNQGDTARLAMANAPDGAQVFQVAPAQIQNQMTLRQLLPPDTLRAMSGRQVTIGAWMWANQPVEARLPSLVDIANRQTYEQRVLVSSQPEFYTFTITLLEEVERAYLALAPAVANPDPSLRIYYDGVLLTAGEFPTSVQPVFENDSASGTWAGAPFTNLVRNGSAESAWWRLRSWVDQLAGFLFSDYGQERLSVALYTLSDASATGWYYRITVRRLAETFWARFGWGQVALPNSNVYTLLNLASMLGFASALVVLVIKRRAVPWSAVLFLALASLVIWGLTGLRGSNYIFVTPYYPSARYAYPVIAPLILALSAGWWGLLQPAARRLAPEHLTSAGMALGLLVLNVYAWISIAGFYAAQISG